MSNNPFFFDESDIAKRMIWNLQNLKSQCSIAKVVAINTTPVSVNIQPLVNYFDTITKWESYPVLNYIPVAQMQTNTYAIHTPLNIGDTGLVIWFDREVYTCLLNGATSTTTPNSGDLSDTNACVFIPMMPSFAIANALLPNGVDFISSEVSLLGQLLITMNDLSLTLGDVTNLLTALSAFATTCESSSDTVLQSAATTLVAALIPITSSIATVTTSISGVTNALTNFRGAQP